MLWALNDLFLIRIWFYRDIETNLRRQQQTNTII